MRPTNGKDSERRERLAGEGFPGACEAAILTGCKCLYFNAMDQWRKVSDFDADSEVISWLLSQSH